MVPLISSVPHAGAVVQIRFHILHGGCPDQLHLSEDPLHCFQAVVLVEGACNADDACNVLRADQLRLEPHRPDRSILFLDDFDGVLEKVAVDLVDEQERVAWRLLQDGVEPAVARICILWQVEREPIVDAIVLLSELGEEVVGGGHQNIKLVCLLERCCQQCQKPALSTACGDFRNDDRPFAGLEAREDLGEERIKQQHVVGRAFEAIFASNVQNLWEDRSEVLSLFKIDLRVHEREPFEEVLLADRLDVVHDVLLLV